jgi:hypothetical protein
MLGIARRRRADQRDPATDSRFLAIAWAYVRMIYAL